MIGTIFCAADGCETWATRGEFCSKHYKERKPKKAKKPRRPLLSEKPIKRSNPKRKQKRFEENFGGAEYRAYIVSLPCDICGVEGYSDPAHLKTRGSGGKAKVLAPLCGPHPTGRHGELGIGCHRIYDEHRWWLPEGTEELLKKIAAIRRAAWLRVSGTPE